MTLEEGYYVVGVYEDFRRDAFPTNVLPIVAHYGPDGYQRWNYRIDVPYRLRLLEPVGTRRNSAEQLFPVFTYRLCVPQRFSETCEVIALSAHEVLVTRSRLALIAGLACAAIRHLHDPVYVVRAWTTIRNAFEAIPRKSRSR